MAGLEFKEEIPFEDVYIHGTVRDIEGKKMSKSLGNIIDPLEIIKEYGADALRFSLISITAQGQDVYLSKERFEQGRNFANKIWNASRFILMNLDEKRPEREIDKTGLDIVDRWILSRFYSLLKEVNRDLDNYKFNEAANALYSFFWHEFCDWYLELIKPAILGREETAEKKNQAEITKQVLYGILEKFLRILHPFMPFITEEIWQLLSHRGSSIMIQPLPIIEQSFINKRTEGQMSLVFLAITMIRNMRQELEVPLLNEINVVISAADKSKRQLFESMSGNIKRLTRLGELEIREDYKHIKSSVTTVIKDLHITIMLEGVVDIEKEKKKIESRIDKLEAEIKAKKRILSNKDFIEKAPEGIVKKEEEKFRMLNDTLRRLKDIKDELR